MWGPSERNGRFLFCGFVCLGRASLLWGRARGGSSNCLGLPNVAGGDSDDQDSANLITWLCICVSKHCGRHQWFTSSLLWRCLYKKLRTWCSPGVSALSHLFYMASWDSSQEIPAGSLPRLRGRSIEIQRCSFPKDYGENGPLRTGKGDDTQRNQSENTSTSYFIHWLFGLL